MKDILIKREDLRNRSQKLRVIKFDDKIDKDQVAVLIKEQDKVYKKWKFYNGIVKALNKKEKKL